MCVWGQVCAESSSHLSSNYSSKSFLSFFFLHVCTWSCNHNRAGQNTKDHICFHVSTTRRTVHTCPYWRTGDSQYLNWIKLNLRISKDKFALTDIEKEVVKELLIVGQVCQYLKNYFACLTVRFQQETHAQHSPELLHRRRTSSRPDRRITFGKR